MKQQIFQNDVTWNIVNSLLLRHIRYFSYFSQTSHMHPILVDISVTYIYIYICHWNIYKYQNLFDWLIYILTLTLN